MSYTNMTRAQLHDRQNAVEDQLARLEEETVNATGTPEGDMRPSWFAQYRVLTRQWKQIEQEWARRAGAPTDQDF